MALISPNRSSVAFRIQASFAAAAALPLLLLVAISYYLVTETLRDKALREAHVLAKDTAMQVFDRLKFVHDELLILQHASDGASGLPELRHLDLGQRVTNLLRVQPQQAMVLGGQLENPARTALLEATAGVDISKPLLIALGSGPQQRLFLLVADASTIAQRGFLAAELNTAYLWDTTDISSRPERVCVLDPLARPVFCNGPDTSVWLSNSLEMVHGRMRPRPLGGDAGETLLTAAWSLFLKPHYQIERWTVLVGIPQSLALSAVHTFEWVFAAIGVISVLLAILLGSRLIRSNLGPLKTLTAATHQLASGHFERRVDLHSGDEFQLLGDAFDDMASRIGRQFNELQTLARLDRALQAAKTLESALEAANQALQDLLGLGRSALVCQQRTEQGARLLYVPFTQNAVGELADDTVAEPRPEATSGSMQVDAGYLGAAPEDQLRYISVANGPQISAQVILRDPRESDAALVSRVGDVLGITLNNLVLERMLIHQARYDWLSGLPNRLQLHDHFGEWTTDDQPTNEIMAMLLFDLDNFKQINDSQGHNAADELLADVARRLRAALPEECVLSRLAGDEFVVMLRHASETGATEQLERLSEEISAALDRPFSVGLRLSASYGGALYPHHGRTFETMLQALDAAMHAAKSARRGSFLLFSERMRESILGRIEIEHALKGALKKRELLLHYQPVVDAVTGKVLSAEALMRWQRPGVGLVFPGGFMEIAESSGLVVPFGAWAVGEACRQLAAWRHAGYAIESVAVNVSGVQLADDAFEHQVIQALDETGLGANHLALEVTETALIGRFEESVARLQRLREHGVQVMVDDFGTGYASLKYLKMLPVDGLKIDRLFVKDLPDSARDEAIIAAVVSLAQSSGIKLVAEGVESKQQALFLRDAGLHRLQGFLFDRGLPANEFEQRLHKEQALGAVEIVNG